MARGTTAEVTATGTSIITQALYEIAMYGPNDTIPPADLADALVVLDYMIKLFQGSPTVNTSGLKMWQRTRASLTLTAAISFALKLTGGALDVNPPVAILSAMLKNTDSEETPLEPMLLEEHEQITDKTQTGVPGKFYYEREYAQGTLYLDVVPDDTTDVIDLIYLRPLYDMDAIGNDVDFPQHWYMALYLNLAILLAPRYGKEAYQTTQKMAVGALAMAQTFYPEDVNAHFEPDKE